MDHILGFDVGGTKVAWGCFSTDGTLIRNGQFPTPKTSEQFVKSVIDIIREQDAQAVGIGIAGTITPDGKGTRICGNIPQLNELPLASLIQDHHKIPVVVDNDARCALIGESWQGAAVEMTSCVLITLGTGVGGAIMQKEKILPHPQDLSEEIGRIVVDPTDVFPAKCGSGTVEAFIGGKNLEDRLQLDLHEQAELIRRGDAEAKEVWHAISYYFIKCIQAIHAEYRPRCILVGGIGAKDLEYYLQDPSPCSIIPTELGAHSGIYGAARRALDLYEEAKAADEEWS